MANKNPITKPKNKGVSPNQWMAKATPAQIGDAILACGPEKTAQVMAYLIQQAGPEVRRRLDQLADEFENRPGAIFGRALRAIFRS